MKFGCSLEMVNMLTSGPNFIYKQSKKFWTDYFKFTAAAGFQGIELPFNPFHGDPMAFETGRCGIPCNAQAVLSKYGSPDEFLEFLKEVGIEQVTSIHANANDAMLELAAAGKKADQYYDLLKDMGKQAIAHAKSLKAGGIVFSPTPELGWIHKIFGESKEEEFSDITIEILNDICASARKEGILLSLKTAYHSLYRGAEMEKLLNAVKGAKLCPDLAHMEIAGDPIKKVIASHKNQIAYLRLSDTAFEDKHENYKRINAELPVYGAQKVFCDLGEGKVDLLGALRVLENAAYEGWVICEQKKTLDVYRGLLKMRWFVDHEIIPNLSRQGVE